MAADSVDYICIHEDQIQNQSRKIAELETRADYKERRIDEMNEKIEKIDSKLDEINKNVNDLILQSTKGDSSLELRLKAIETELQLQKQTAADIRAEAIDNRADANLKIAIIGIVFAALTFYFNFIH